MRNPHIWIESVPVVGSTQDTVPFRQKCSFFKWTNRRLDPATFGGIVQRFPTLVRILHEPFDGSVAVLTLNSHAWISFFAIGINDHSNSCCCARIGLHPGVALRRKSKT